MPPIGLAINRLTSEFIVDQPSNVVILQPWNVEMSTQALEFQLYNCVITMTSRHMVPS